MNLSQIFKKIINKPRLNLMIMQITLKVQAKINKLSKVH